MCLDFVTKLGLQVYKIRVSAQKINHPKLDIFCIVISSFSIEDEKKRSCFFEETFLLPNFSMNVALGISLLP